MLASDLIVRAKRVAADNDGIRFSDPEWLDWLNDGQLQVVILRPSANMKTAVMSLVSGTRQSLPADGVLFDRVNRNMGAGGTPPGAAPRRASRQQLDAFMPNWHTATATASIDHYIFEDSDSRAFWVYPPADGTAKVEVRYAARPTAVASTASAITLDEAYANALLDYMLYRAYSKDTEVQANLDRAALYLSAFERALGAKSKGDVIAAS